MYAGEHIGNKYLTLVHTDESKEALKKCGELWKKIEVLIRSINKNADNYEEKYMKIRFNSYDNILKKH